TAYYPMTHLIKYARGVSLIPVVECDTYDIPGYATSDFHQYGTHKDVPYIETAAAFDKANGNLIIFVINRNWKEDIQLELDVRSFEGYKFEEQLQLYTDDLNAANSYEDSNVVIPSVCQTAKCENNKVSTTVKKLSWNVFRFCKE
ncbi:MAG: hypothetical protein JSU79_02530, partial [Dehalococcoidales bacterium]